VVAVSMFMILRMAECSHAKVVALTAWRS